MNLVRTPDPFTANRSRFVAQGDCVVTDEDDLVLTTVLGSCVALCCRHPASGIGGLNHFLLPEDPRGKTGKDDGAARRYGVYAIDALVNEICKLAGVHDRKSLELRAYGGAMVMRTRSDVGAANVRCVKEVLARDGLRLVDADFGGKSGRRLKFHAATGAVWVRTLPNFDAKDEAAAKPKRERAAPAAPSVELF